jgi:hypothetical protein
LHMALFRSRVALFNAERRVRGFLNPRQGKSMPMSCHIDYLPLPDHRLVEHPKLVTNKFAIISFTTEP